MKIAFLYPLIFLFLILFEIKRSLPAPDISDVGFSLTHPIYQLLKRKPTLTYLFSIWNGIVMMTCFSVLLDRFFHNNFDPSVLSYLSVMVLRALLGSITSLPIPPQHLSATTDLPPSGYPCFYLISGHTALLFLILYRNNTIQWWGILLLLMQTIRLISTRSHYTIDILLGLLLPYLFLNHFQLYIDSNSHSNIL